MSSSKSKLRLIFAFAALASLALAVSCRGFFVNPTLTSLAIGPTTVSLSPAQTYQMTATGTFNDGSQRNVTSQAVWSSSDSAVASIGQTSGLVSAATTATTIGTVTITASDGAITATTTATVNVCPVVSDLVIQDSASSAPPNGNITFTATATVGSAAGQVVTSIVTFTAGDTSVMTLSGNVGTMVGTSGLSTTVTATLCNVASTNTLTVSVQ